MAIEWRKDYATGVRMIDEQHKQLFSRFDDLVRAIGEGRGKAEIGRTFDFLDKYVAFHFRDEEKLQQEVGYPHLVLHQEEHRYFLAELAKLEQMLHDVGRTEELVHLTERVLLQWLVQHICRMDKALGDFVKDKKRNEVPDYRSW